MKIRSRACRNCAHLWASPVRYSKNAVGISGEAAEYCPRCNSRDVDSGPQQDIGTTGGAFTHENRHRNHS